MTRLRAIGFGITMQTAAQAAALAAAYFIAARIGLHFGFVEGSVTPVWPPSGIAVAALLRLGPGLWPGIAAGAFAATAASGAAAPIALAIGVGNTLESVAAAWLLRRAGIDDGLDKVRGVLLFLLFGVALPPVIAAGIGSAALILGGPAMPGTAPSLLAVWWVGDAMAILILAPLLLAWTRPLIRPTEPIREIEAAVMLVFGIVGTMIVFEMADLPHGTMPLAFLTFPWLVWAALRFQQRGATTAIAIAGLIAVAQTVGGEGPFAGRDLTSTLVILQLFLATITVPTLLLAAAIAERDRTNAELAEARKEAEAANHAKTRLLAAVRHDLSQPMQAATLFTEILAQKVDEDQRELVDHLRGSLAALGATLEAVNDLSRLGAGLEHPEFTVFPARDLTDQCAAEFKALAEAKGLAFRYVPCEAPVVSDSQLLGRVLRNLLANALRYTAHGKILLGARRRGDSLRIEVWDTGCGIPPDRRRDIFLEFHRLGCSNDEGGLGLGLAIVERIAKLLGLRIEVHSEPEFGSGFIVEVPLDAGARGS